MLVNNGLDGPALDDDEVIELVLDIAAMGPFAADELE